MTEDLRAKALAALPLHHYVVDTEHTQHGDYGGDCKIESYVYCGRCLVAAPLGMKSTQSKVAEISPWCGEHMGQLMAAMLRHEQQVHGGIPVE